MRIGVLSSGGGGGAAAKAAALQVKMLTQFEFLTAFAASKL
jgi:hypothetical protein